MKKRLNRDEALQEQYTLAFFARTTEPDPVLQQSRLIIEPKIYTKREAEVRREVIEQELAEVERILANTSDFEFEADINLEELPCFNRKAQKIREMLLKNSNLTIRAKIETNANPNSMYSDMVEQIVDTNYKKGNYSVVSLNDKGRRHFGARYALSPLQSSYCFERELAQKDILSAEKEFKDSFAFIPYNKDIAEKASRNDF